MFPILVMSSNNETIRMARRALLTDAERDAIKNPESRENPYVAVSRVRKKINEELTEDIEILEENHQELLEELRDVVCQETMSERVGGQQGEFTENEPDTRTTAPGSHGREGRDLVERAVEQIAENWDQDKRLESRKAAAEVVLRHAIETDGYVGKEEAVERFRDEYPVSGQEETTWWRKNAREVLSEIGDYSRGYNGYQVHQKDVERFVKEGDNV